MFLTVAALSVLASVIFGVQLYQHERDQLLQQLTSAMAQASSSEIRRITSDLRRHMTNVRELEHSPVIQHFLASRGSESQSFAGNGTEFWRTLVAEQLRATVMANPDYLQLRLVDVDPAGQELVRLERVDGRVVEAARDRLQAKADRYYYQEGRKLSPREMYLSRLDLNREQGVIEVPWKPTYRVVTPVYDDTETKRALLIVNVDADEDLAEIAGMGDQFTRGLPTETYLATAYGSWAVHPNGDYLFGADLNTGHSLAADEPRLAMMAEELVRESRTKGTLDSSQLIPGKGLVHLSLLPAGEGDQRRHLKLFHVLPEAAIRSEIIRNTVPLLLAASLLAVLLLVLVLVFVYRQLRPLEEITELARRAAEGDYDAPLPDSSGNDEVGMLTSAFQTLLREVRLREDALHDSRDFLDVVLQGIAEGVAAVDSDGRILRANRAMGTIFGYPPGALEGIAVERLVPTDSRAGHTQLREAYARRPETRRLGSGRQLYGQRRDGSTFPVDLALTPVTQGSRTMIVLTAIDVTSRVNADREIRDLNQTLEKRVAERTAELEQVQQRMQLATKASGIGLWTFHPKEKTLDWDDGMYRLYGLDSSTVNDELIDAWRKAVLPGDLPKTDQLLAEAVKQSDKLDVRFRIRRPDGQIRHIHAIGVVLRNSEGRPVSMIGTNHDQTEQIHTQVMMQEARDAALQASRAKGDFLANMSHEIRTPMNGVIGMCNLLLDTDLDEQQRVRANGIRTSADALLTIINDILDYSKVEAGQVDIEPVDFRMDHLLSDLASTMAVKAHEKGLELICPIAVFPPNFTQFLADAGRIRQVLTNLLSNAIKFTDKGEVAVDFQILSADAGMATIRFEVADTGIGIPPSKIPNLFERFVQADSSTTRIYGGTGLGLAISKHLVELMGGDIGVESEPGHGSTFWFTLPLQRASDRAVQKTSLTLPGRHRVLTVDDSERYTQLMSELLACWGVEHEASTSGPEALKRIYGALESASPFNIVIIDQHLKGMGGLPLARRIRADEKLSDLRIVMLRSPGHRDDSVPEIGGQRLPSIDKPLTQSQLYNILAIELGLLERTQWTDRSLAIEGEQQRFKARALVVEDNPINQLVAKGLLERFGLIVEVAGNGKEAVESLANVDYDIVFMDVHMPVMDGYAATAVIRDTASAVLRHDVPIIALTANAIAGEREKSLAAGMNDHVAKPVDVKRLADALNRWIPETAQAGLRQKSTQQSDRESASAESAPMENRLTPIFDRANLLERVFDEESLVERLVDMYLTDGPRMHDELAAAIASDDAEKMAFATHALKGSAMSIGGPRLAAVCLAMENAARAGDTLTVQKLWPAAQIAFDELINALKEEIN